MSTHHFRLEHDEHARQVLLHYPPARTVATATFLPVLTDHTTSLLGSIALINRTLQEQARGISHPHVEIPNNAALKDMLLALKRASSKEKFHPYLQLISGRYGTKIEPSYGFPRDLKSHLFGDSSPMPEEFALSLDLASQLHEGFRFERVYFDDTTNLSGLQKFVRKHTPQNYSVQGYFSLRTDEVTRGSGYSDYTENSVSCSRSKGTLSLVVRADSEERYLPHFLKLFKEELGLEEIVEE